MKKRLKFILPAVSVLIIVLAVTAFAANSKTAELWYNNIKIAINGAEISPKDANGNIVEPFIIDGTTYLPVRGIASALDLDVGWDANSNTVTLNKPGVFSGAVKVYEDENVLIEFAACRAPEKTSYLNYYYIDFNITNKTDTELSFQPSAISFDGVSYNKLLGSEDVAPHSTGKISFYSNDTLPTGLISKTSGKIRVIDFSENYLKNSYDASWDNVTQK